MKRTISYLKKRSSHTRLRSNISIVLLGSILSLVLSLSRTWLLIDSLIIEEYGEILLVINFYTFLGVVLDVKIVDILFKYIPRLENSGEDKMVVGLYYAAMAIPVMIIILFSFLFFVFGKTISGFLYGETEIYSLLVVFHFAGCLALFNGFSTAVLRINDKFGATVWPVVLGNAFIVLMLVHSHFNLSYTQKEILVLIAIGSGAGTLFPLFLGVYTIRKRYAQYSILDSVLSLKKVGKDVLSTVFQTTLASYLKLGSETGGVFLLGVLSTPAQVAIYNVALQMLRPLTILQNSIGAAIFPEISRMVASGERLEVKRFTKAITSFLMLISAPLLLVLFFLASIFVKQVANTEYNDSMQILYVLSVGSVLAFVTLPFYQLAVLFEKLRFRNIIVSVRFVYLGIAVFFGFNSLSLSFSQSVGSLTTRIFNDYKLYKEL